MSPAGLPVPAGEIGLIDDDGRTLWASPTHGEPLNLAYLPPGVQFIVALRPAALASHAEGTKVLTAIGPLGESARVFVNDLLPPEADIEGCVIGCGAASGDRWQTALVVRLSNDFDPAEFVATQLPGAIVKHYGGKSYHVANEWAYFFPDDKSASLLVIAPGELIEEIIELDGNPPPLRRDIERLLKHTDAERQVTVVLAPNALFSGDQRILSGPLAALHDPLFWFLGDELSAIALSMHWDENFFIELAATPTLDTSPERASRILAERVAQIPDRLEEFVVTLNPHTYGRRIIARFPGMLRKLATYTRRGFDADHAVLRCYLPAIAGHNLLMGAELTLAEAGGESAPSGNGSQWHTVAEATAPLSPRGEGEVGARLKRVTSLVIARDTLEGALQLLAQDLGVEVVILGADLQAEGITKNQSLGIDTANRPAEEIMVEILRQANPDKTAAGPGDLRQKLVYVIARPDSGKAEQIVITTRAGAAERGDTLPAVFQAVQP